MRRSDIFGEFVKIAKEKGLISEANPDHAEHTEQNTKSPRWDSFDLSAIEALYGVKPEQSKGMDYDNNIMEVAHPESEVIAPSYDRLNGLIENEMEAQNIKLHIIKKTPDGFLTQRKYAEKELLLSLVRVANDMDNKDKEELRLLADTCLGQLHRQPGIRKEALIPLLIGAAIVLGVTYLVEHLPDVDQGLRGNYETLQNQLNDFLTADITLGFGHKYDQTLKQDVSNLRGQLARFWSIYDRALPIIHQLEKPATPQQVIQLAKSPGITSVQRAYEALRAAATAFAPYLDKTEENFSDPDYKAEHTQKGGATSLIDEVPFLHGGKSSLLADDFDDVINAIKPFKDSVKRLLDLLVKSQSLQEKAKADFEQASSRTQTWLGNDPFVGGTPLAPPDGQRSVPDIDDEAEKLNRELGDAGIFI